MSDMTWENNMKNWGNPFYHDILDGESYHVYISLMSPIEAYQLLQKTINKTFNLTIPTGPLIYTLRYNPETDKGLKNKAWILSTSKTAPTTPPDDINLILEGFPLYILFWDGQTG